MNQQSKNEQRFEESSKVVYQSIIVNIILTVFKITAGVVGNSNAMIADGVHSASDIVTSVGVLFGNFVAKKPQDDDHNYGHEKAETLAAFVLSMILIVVGWEIGFKSAKLLFNLQDVKIPTVLPLAAAVVSIIFKEYQYFITIRVAKKINSPSLMADAWHHRSDSLSSLGVLIGIGGAMMGFKFLDPVAGIVVSLMVLKVGIEILKDSANELMDYSVPKEEEIMMRDIILETEGVNSITNLRTRKHGPVVYVDLAICVEPTITVLEGHEIAHRAEDALKEKIENVKGVSVHLDACSRDCKKGICN